MQIKHVTVKSGKLSLISGYIDPKSHLNLDYPYHLVKQCIVAEKFEIGSNVQMSDGGGSGSSFVFAGLDPTLYRHYGKYDYTQNLQNMINAVKSVRDKKTISQDN